MSIVFPSIEVQDQVRGDEFNYKASCRLSSAQNANWTTSATAAFATPTLTISALTAGASLGLIDSVESVVGNRILLKDMAALSGGAAADNGFNGLWEVTGGTTVTLTLVRTYDLQVGDNPHGITMWIKEGTLWANTAWVCPTSGVAVADDGTNDFTFTQYDVRGTLTVSRGGTGATTFTTGQLLQGNGTGALTASGVVAANVITNASASTDNAVVRWDGATGKLIQDSSVILSDTDSFTGIVNIGMSGDIFDVNGNELINFTATVSAVNEISITNSATGNAPILGASGEANIGLVIQDSNSNQLIIMSSVASAINEITLSNAATGTNPSFSATGGDTNIGIDFQSKGTGHYRMLGSAAQSAELRLFEDTDNGSNYGAISVPSAVTTSFTLRLPDGVGSNGQVLSTDGNNPAQLSWAAASGGAKYFTLSTFQITANQVATTEVVQFAWDLSEFGGFTTNTIGFWHQDVTNRDLTVQVYDVTNATSLGTTTVTSVAANAIVTFTFSDPASDARIVIRVSKSAVGGTHPSIYGIWMSLV